MTEYRRILSNIDAAVRCPDCTDLTIEKCALLLGELWIAAAEQYGAPTVRIMWPDKDEAHPHIDPNIIDTVYSKKSQLVGIMRRARGYALTDNWRECWCLIRDCFELQVAA